MMAPRDYGNFSLVYLFLMKRKWRNDMVNETDYTYEGSPPRKIMSSFATELIAAKLLHSTSKEFAPKGSNMLMVINLH